MLTSSIFERYIYKIIIQVEEIRVLAYFIDMWSTHIKWDIVITWIDERGGSVYTIYIKGSMSVCHAQLDIIQFYIKEKKLQFTYSLFGLDQVKQPQSPQKLHSYMLWVQSENSLILHR